MEKHVTNLEISKRLKEIGVRQESEFYWLKMNKAFSVTEWEWFLVEKKKQDLAYQEQGRSVSAFLASELGELLPGSLEFTQKTIASTTGKKGFRIWKTRSQFKDGLISWHMGYIDRPETVVEERTMPDAMGKMLCYLIENKLISSK